ncbi:sigma-54-dependent transcriptional regulator [Aquabacterium sp.]|uniref:sigma-54-dependent transcriptional regulator n=1 Tax=Aquabacterium sp. TaxID=1872578 RepID=UPI0035B1982D
MSQPAERRLPAILVVDDEPRSLEAIRRTAEEDFEVFCASSAAQAIEVLEQEQASAGICIVLTDQRMPDTTGVQFLKTVRERWPDLVRIILSGYTDSDDIISGVNDAGIWQYLLKPWQPEQLLLTLQRAAEVWRLQQDNLRLALDLRIAGPTLKRQVERRRSQAHQQFGLDALIRAEDSPMQAVCDLISKVAPYDLSVLVTGESGTGKEMVARAIHYESERADKAFITQNCGAVPDTLLESELFGHKRGAFTGAVDDRIGLFQQADGGTLFLDEIGETSPAFQVKLLRVLQEGEFRPLGSTRTVTVDVRVIAATNRDLEADVRDGRFREDLYYRLATIALRVPPLRERPMDLPLLADTLLRRFQQELGKTGMNLTPGLLARLVSHGWPGNVRELQNQLIRLVALSEDGALQDGLFTPRPQGALSASPEQTLATLTGGTLQDRVDALETATLRDAMLRHAGNKSRVARELGLSRVGLRAKLARYGLGDAE